MTITVPARQRQMLLSQWQQHTYAKFELRDADAVLETLTENPHVFCVPSGCGARGKEGVREFYANRFLPRIPPDMELLSISEIFAENHVVAEYVTRFTHTLQMDWMLPGIAPSGRRAELLLIVVIGFENGKIASEHVYWDGAALLSQLRVLDSAAATAGIGSAAKLLKSAAQRALAAESLTLLA